MKLFICRLKDKEAKTKQISLNDLVFLVMGHASCNGTHFKDFSITDGDDVSSVRTSERASYREATTAPSRNAARAPSSRFTVRAPSSRHTTRAWAPSWFTARAPLSRHATPARAPTKNSAMASSRISARASYKVAVMAPVQSRGVGER